MSDARDVMATLERATDSLVPVVVDLGSSCFDTYMHAIEHAEAQEGQELLVLHPIAASALPTDHHGLFTVYPATAGHSWALRCADLTADGPTRASIGVQGIRLSDEMATRDQAVQTSDLLVLVVSGGLDDGADYVFPIARVGKSSCEVRCSMGLAPGTELPRVELIGDRRLLRTASAQVTSTMPWYGALGERGFISRLALNPVADEASEPAHDLVTDPREVKRLLRLASMRQTLGHLELPGRARSRARFLEVKDDHALFEIDCDPQLNLKRTSVRIAFELFSVAHEMEVRAIERDGSKLRTALPLILRRRRRHRRDARTSAPPELGIELRFRNPITGLVASYPVTEASFYGVAFRCSAQAPVLWQGMPLEQAQLVWGHRLVHLGDLAVDETVMNDGMVLCSALTQDSRLQDDLDLIELLAEIAHPQVRMHDGTSFETLHETYLKAGLFGPHMDRNLAPMLEETASVWRKLHADGRDVVRTFEHGPKDAPDGAVTVMRAWESGWVLQHFVDVSTERQGATSKLQFAYLDHLVPRPDGRFMIFFVKEDNHIMNAYLRRFFETTGTAEALSVSLVELWIRIDPAPHAKSFASEISVEPCMPEDEPAVAHAAQRCFGQHAAASVSIVPGQMTLPDTTARFARADLVRTRDCRVVRRNGRIVYAVLEERSSPGLNLTWMLNAAWVIPVHPELDGDGQAFERALCAVIERPSQSATGERFLNLPPGLDEARLASLGFAREAALNFYVLNRAGLHRLFHYTAVRCGELEAMVMRRQRKRQSKA